MDYVYTPLSPAEFDAINKAAEIIRLKIAPDASINFGFNHWHGSQTLTGFSHFNAIGVQRPCVPGDTLADKIDNVIAAEAEECINALEIRARKMARKIASLKAELAALEA
jgi:hypothetical protein